jgi:hypothetical protein
MGAALIVSVLMLPTSQNICFVDIIGGRKFDYIAVWKSSMT